MSPSSPGEAHLEDLVAGVWARGVAEPGEVVVVESVTWHGANAVTVVYRDEAGRVDRPILHRGHQPSLRVLQAGPVAAFAADPADFKLVAEALRIRMAGRFDPLLAVSTSLVRRPIVLTAYHRSVLLQPRSSIDNTSSRSSGAGTGRVSGRHVADAPR